MKPSSAKRVLMLLENCFYPRDDRVRREARTLAQAGYDVSVICPAASGQPQQEALEGMLIYRYPLPRPGSGFLGYLWEYGYSMLAIFTLSLRVWLTKGFDIVHAHHPPDTFVFVGAFFKLLGKRYVLDHHDLAPELYYARFGGVGNRLVYRALVGLERQSCWLADRVIATNESYKAIEMRRGHVPERRITIVRNGPDLNELYPSDPDPNLRARAGTIIGYVGVMGIQDGVDYLVRALRHLRYDLGRDDFYCILVGDGAALPSVRALVAEADLAEHVLFTGWVGTQQEVGRYISSMDICVAPEPSDPYNDRSTAAKVMEYMALGKPTVAFDLPEHRFTAQCAALYARPNDELDLARKIAVLMDDPERRREMGQKGRERVETELAWVHQAKHLLEAYHALEDGPKRRAACGTVQPSDVG